MDKVSFLDELQDRLSALMRNTPAADMQKNLKALLTQQFARLELVTREEFDTQTKVLENARQARRAGAQTDRDREQQEALSGRRFGGRALASNRNDFCRGG
jgi:BMFP domain-containing protein YqiC